MRRSRKMSSIILGGAEATHSVCRGGVWMEAQNVGPQRSSGQTGPCCDKRSDCSNGAVTSSSRRLDRRGGGGQRKRQRKVTRSCRVARSGRRCVGRQRRVMRERRSPVRPEQWTRLSPKTGRAVPLVRRMCQDADHAMEAHDGFRCRYMFRYRYVPRTTRGLGHGRVARLPHLICLCSTLLQTTRASTAKLIEFVHFARVLLS